MSTPTAPAGLDELKAHIGRRESATDVITAAPANLLRLTFSRDEPELRPGDPLPPGWQCLYFLPRFPPDGLRPDGSPLDTGVVPPMPLPRRMFAGERFRFHRPLRIGETVRRETELADISRKTGGTGVLVFATVVQRIFAGDALAIEEERRTVFREEVKAGERNQVPRREAAPTPSSHPCPSCSPTARDAHDHDNHDHRPRLGAPDGRLRHARRDRCRLRPAHRPDPPNRPADPHRTHRPDQRGHHLATGSPPR